MQPRVKPRCRAVTIDLRCSTSLRAFDTPTMCNALELVAPDRRGDWLLQPAVRLRLPRHAADRRLRPHGDDPRRGAAGNRRRPSSRRCGWPTTSTWPPRPGPTITVLQDLDPEPGFGAFWGEVNTAVHKGLGVLGCITNGSIRDLDMIATDFQLLAGCVGAEPRLGACRGDRARGHRARPAVRHGRPDPCRPPWCGGRPGRLVGELPMAIDLCTRREAPIIAAARQPDFTVEKLRAAMAEADDIH